MTGPHAAWAALSERALLQHLFLFLLYLRPGADRIHLQESQSLNLHSPYFFVLPRLPCPCPCPRRCFLAGHNTAQKGRQAFIFVAALGLHLGLCKATCRHPSWVCLAWHTLPSQGGTMLQQPRQGTINPHCLLIPSPPLLCPAGELMETLGCHAQHLARGAWTAKHCCDSNGSMHHQKHKAWRPGESWQFTQT